MRFVVVLVVGLAVLLSGVATTAAYARTCPCSIFADGDGPADPGFNDGRPLELGVKFQSARAGTVTGVRFYKSAHDSGDHSVHLWAADGTLLASAPSTSESPAGWQTVTFSKPPQISADTTYIASYHSGSGWYTFAYGAFSEAIDNPPLRALADGEDGSNGVFAYGPSTFPTSGYKASGYWVDVVFEPLPEPVPAPRPVKRSPDSDDAPFDGDNVQVAFDAPVDSSTINSETFWVQPESGDPLLADVSYDEETRSATWQPRRPLAPSTRYVATLRGGAGGVTGTNGTPLAEDVTWRFTTASGESPSTDVAGPVPEPDVADPASGPARACVSRRRFRIRLAVPTGAEVRSAVVKLNGKRLTVSRGMRLTARVDLRDLPKGRYSVHIRIRLADGRQLRETRTYRTCAFASRAQLAIAAHGGDGASHSSAPKPPVHPGSRLR